MAVGISNLQRLNQRLKELKDKNAPFPKPHSISDENFHRDDTTTDHVYWIQQVEHSDNNPSLWLEYITTYEKECSLNPDERIIKLTKLYSRSLQAITNPKHRKSEAYAKLMVNFAKFKSTEDPGIAKDIFRRAIAECGRHPFVHIEAANYYCSLENSKKGIKILEDACNIHQCVDNTLTEALKNLKVSVPYTNNDANNKENINCQQNPKANNDNFMQFANSLSVSKRSRHLSDGYFMPENIRENFNNKQAIDNDQSARPLGNADKSDSSTTPIKEPLQFDKHVDSYSQLRSYHSTPDCKSVGLLSNSCRKGSVTKRNRNWKPMRVPVSELQKLNENEEDEGMELSGIFPLMKVSNPVSKSECELKNCIETPCLPAVNQSAAIEELDKIGANGSHSESDKEDEQDQEQFHHINQERKYSVMDISFSEAEVEAMDIPQDNKMSVMDVYELNQAATIPEIPISSQVENHISIKTLPLPSLQPTHIQQQHSKPDGCSFVPNVSQGGAAPLPFKVPAVPKATQVMVVNNKSYSVLNLIGRGGTSKVYQVFSHENKKTFAIKKVDLEGCDDATIHGYLNEINLLHQLQNCDKVVKMYDCEYNVEQAMLFVVMERGDTDLACLFNNRSKKPLNENAICFYWQCMLEAVQALHQRDIVHSDLKPANFLMVAGHLKLIDFGIANAIQGDKTSVTREQQIGTPNYMSPEAIYSRSSQVDSSGRLLCKYKLGVKSDVWSLGCILYNMVFGHTPFQSFKDMASKLQAIVNPAVPITFPDIQDKNVLNVLKSCLQRDPKVRPSIDDLVMHPYLTGKKPEKVAGCSDQDKLLRKIDQVPALQRLLSDNSPGRLNKALMKFLTQQNMANIPQPHFSD